MKIIAHKIENADQAQKALAGGADFVEVDVAKRIVFSKFTIQHHGLKGKFGIGKSLDPLLSVIVPNKLLLDIKHASFSLTFAQKLSTLLIACNIDKTRICGRDWVEISQVCQKTGCLPFYTIRGIGDIRGLEKILPKLEKPAGFCVRHDLIDADFISYSSNAVRTSRSRSKNKMADFEIWAWTVNDLKEVRRLKDLGVDGIITDEWGKLKQEKSAKFYFSP